MRRSQLPGLPRTKSPYFFFFNDTATTEIYTLSLHDALPIFKDISYAVVMWPSSGKPVQFLNVVFFIPSSLALLFIRFTDRKSTRLNSSHANISYAVFCLKKNNLILDPSLCEVFCLPTCTSSP